VLVDDKRPSKFFKDMKESSSRQRWLNTALIFMILILTVNISWNSISRFCKLGLPSIGNVFASKGDPWLMWYGRPYAAIGLRAQALIPEDGCVTMVGERPLKTQTVKYYLYPVRVLDEEANKFNREPPACHGQYVLDIGQKITTLKAGWTKIALPDRAALYVKQDAPLAAKAARPAGWPADIGSFCYFNLLVLAIGYFLLCGLLPHVGKVPLGGKLGTSYLLGFVATTMVFWPLLLAHIPLGFILVCCSLHGALILSYLFMRMRGVDRPAPLSFSRISISEGLLGTITFAVLLFFVLYIIAYPPGLIDEMHIWLLKAKIIFDKKMLTFDYTENTNNYYPVLWPLNLALQYVFAGGVYEELAKWTSGLAFLSLVGLVKFSASALGLGRKESWLTVLVFLVAFNNWTMFTALPENLFVALTALAVVFFLDWMINQRTESLYVVTLALAGLLAVKSEALVVLGSVFLAYGLAERFSLGAFWKRVYAIRIIAISLVVHAVWLIWLKLQHVPYAYHFGWAASIGNFLPILGMAWSCLTRPQAMSILLVAYLGAVLLRTAKPWSGEEKFLFVFSLSLMFFGLWAGLFWPADIFRYYLDVLTRLCFRAMPFVVLLWMSRVFAPAASRRAQGET